MLRLSRNVHIVFAVVFLIIFATGAFAQDPGIADTVRIGDASGDITTPISVPVTLYNDEALTSLIVPVLIEGYSGWMRLDSITYTGGRLENASILPDRENYIYAADTFFYEAVLIRFGVSSGDPLPPGDGTIFDMWFTPRFGGEVTLDSVHFSPYGNLKLTDESMTDFTPEFQAGTVDIACDYIIGDVNMDGAMNIGDFLAIQKYYYGCNPLGPLPPYRDDVNGDRHVDMRDSYFIYAASLLGGPMPECGVYNPAVDDPGIRDTLYIEDAVLYEGVTSYITISYTNDQPITLFGLAFAWDGDADLSYFWDQYNDPNVPGERLPEGTFLTAYCCGTYSSGTSGEFSFYTMSPMYEAFGGELPAGSGAIFNAPFTPSTAGTSTIQMTGNILSGAESMFATSAGEGIVPVVVGGNITVLHQPCGDANADLQVNVGDAVFIITFAFKYGPEPEPMCSGDANSDYAVNVGDAVYLINYAFKGGAAPPTTCCD